MTTEEARTTEVSITGTARGRYGNAHIRYDINDGLVDVILEVIPTEEQRTERARDQKEKKDKRNMTKQQHHEIKENIGHEVMKTHETHAHNTPSQRKVGREARARPREYDCCNCHASPSRHG
jgi:VIT1/CCC1 family predicted Fe2+/Mn2+ transporter